MAFNLASIRKGPQALPPRIVIYGEHGLGKSTFGASAPNPIFIQTEDGLASLDVASFPLAARHEDVLEAVGALYAEEHDYQTVVLDSLDWAEKLIWSYVARKHDKASIEDFGYGRGFTFAAEALAELLAGLNALRTERGMAVVLTAHAQVKRFDDPTSASYDRFELALHKAASALVSEWADVIGFASHDIVVRTEEAGFNKKLKKAVASDRVIYTERAPAFNAKNRYSLPPKLPLSWDSFSSALAESQR
jgi:hypothetical protein